MPSNSIFHKISQNIIIVSEFYSREAKAVRTLVRSQKKKQLKISNLINVNYNIFFFILYIIQKKTTNEFIILNFVMLNINLEISAKNLIIQIKW